MKCKCGNEAVIFRRYEGRPWCARHFSRQLESKVKRTIKEKKLIEKEDRICVGLSGGKDSSLTLYLLKKFFEKRKDLEIFALFVDEGMRGHRDIGLKIAKKFCKNLDTELHTTSFKEEFGKTMDGVVKISPLKSCTYCGVLRRYLLNKKSRELKATKLAVGHNLDDELQSIFLNYLKGDINKLLRVEVKPVVKNKKFIQRIKPLRNIPEKETALYCLVNNLEVQLKHCPYTGESVRFDVRDFLNEMEEKYPGIKFTSIGLYDAIAPGLREYFGKKVKLKECEICGEMTSRKICKTCELLKDLVF
jgi:uncharacterized protein (TIGR00269 family)